MTLSSFLKVHSPTFRGTTNPTEADNWFQAMERALQAQHVPKNQYVEFATYKFEGEAQFWWHGARRLLQQDDVAVSWDAFRVEFYKKYFPNSVRAAKKLELLQLKQGSMMMAEYASKFEELCRFSMVCQGAPESYEEWKCIKYEGGLRTEILTVVGPMEVHIFSELVNKSRVVEEYLRKAVVEKNDCEEFYKNSQDRDLAPRSQDKYFAPRGQNFKRSGHAPQYSQDCNDYQKGDYHKGQGKEKQAGTHQENLRCSRCERYHPKVSCMVGLGLCYHCGLSGHVSRHCPNRKDQDASWS
ncbi:uncharacterized protein LOC107615720 [Arachis ipaensis]|uniref:uncharacterized protein LOC107615720 n=1 Tax=Arachis ipaensis TaxID=130454 RepID=UPI0007AFBD8D|nr:uncharacterized protein LOC107615720 [Arachis ipaensis]